MREYRKYLVIENN